MMKVDTILYVLGAMLASAQGLWTIKEPVTFHEWFAFGMNVVLAGVIAWKAKRSPGKEQGNP